MPVYDKSIASTYQSGRSARSSSPTWRQRRLGWCASSDGNIARVHGSSPKSHLGLSEVHSTCLSWECIRCRYRCRLFTGDLLCRETRAQRRSDAAKLGAGLILIFLSLCHSTPHHPPSLSLRSFANLESFSILVPGPHLSRNNDSIRDIEGLQLRLQLCHHLRP